MWQDKVIEPNTRTVIAGIDPGASGALAFLDSADWSLEVFDMPHVYVEVNKKKRKHVDKAGLAKLLISKRVKLISTEKVHSMPDMPPHSMFSFGRYYGQIEMAALMMFADYLETDPAKWKAQMGVSADKDYSRTRAGLLVPCAVPLLKRKCDHDRAEAIMLAMFGCFNAGLLPKNITLKGA